MEQGLEMVRVVVGLIAVALRPSRGRMSNLYFSDTVLFDLCYCATESGTFRMHPSRTLRIHQSRTSGASVAYFSTGDVSGTYMAGIFGSRPLFRIYVARHQKEQETRGDQQQTVRIKVTYTWFLK